MLRIFILLLCPLLAHAQNPTFTVYATSGPGMGMQIGVGDAVNSFFAASRQQQNYNPINVSSNIDKMTQDTARIISEMNINTSAPIKIANWNIDTKPNVQLKSGMNEWLMKKANETDANISKLSGDYDTSQLSKEIRTWGEFSMDKKKVLMLTDQYATQYGRFQNTHSDLDNLTHSAFKTGLEFLTESAQVTGQGGFQDAYEASHASLEIAKGLLDFGLGITPGISIGKDAYEAITGRNLLDNTELDFSTRSFAVLGVVTAGGSNLIKGSVKAVTALGKAHSIERVLEATKEIWDTKNLRPALASLRKYGIIPKERKRIVRAFTKDSQVKILAEDKEVYRYFTPGLTDPRKEWVTEKLVANPQTDLALKYAGPYEVKKWTIPKGTEVIEGLVAPNFGMPGGTHQIYVFDKTVLK